jgi:hypothetical protein
MFKVERKIEHLKRTLRSEGPLIDVTERVCLAISDYGVIKVRCLFEACKKEFEEILLASVRPEEALRRLEEVKRCLETLSEELKRTSYQVSNRCPPEPLNLLIHLNSLPIKEAKEELKKLEKKFLVKGTKLLEECVVDDVLGLSELEEILKKVEHELKDLRETFLVE